MKSNQRCSRRRFLQITGLAGMGGVNLSLWGDSLAAEASVPAWTWRGVVLGTDASIRIHGLPQKKASRLTRECFDQLRRLEKVFSLYDPASSLCQLNRAGQLNDPPAEFVELLTEARRYSEVTNGAFDVTIQALWACYADHYERTPERPPSESVVREVLSKVDYRKLHVAKRRVAFEEPGMAVTLNGIAQGWITDRVVDHLRNEGVTSTLVNMGEYRALGAHPEKRPWQLGVRGPGLPEDLVDVLPLEDSALAVSGGHSHPFGDASTRHHLLHPRTGRSQPVNRTMAVVAPTATEADALSTACAVVDDTEARSFVRGGSAVLKIYS